MDKINVIWLSVKEGTPGRGYWDQRLLEGFFEDQFHFESVPDVDGGVVVIPGAYQGDCIDKLNAELAKLEWCIVIITSDEENKFPIDKLEHPNMRLYATYYNDKYESDIYWLPIGAANTFDIPVPKKEHNWAFSGQVTHPAREDYIKEIRDRRDGIMIETDGFAKGLEPLDYFKLLGSAKVVPSPAGNVSPDAFRTWEAIEAGAVPIATDKEWHEKAFGSVEFPVIDLFEQVNGYMNDVIQLYPRKNNEVQAWWLKWKRNIKRRIFDEAEEMGELNLHPMVTAIVPCSVVKSHPNISIINETIESIVSQQPNAEIIVTFDGVREQQKDKIEDYEEFKRRFLWECFHNPMYKNVLPLIFTEHMHQVKMAREAMEYVDTELVLYCEQDTPLTPDREIDWQACYDLLEKGEADLIRFHFEAFIPEPHKHLMIGKPVDGFLKTIQWSQRPHLATKAYYGRVLKYNFSEDAICFIEDKMHGVVIGFYDMWGMKGWYQHRLVIYHPEGDIKRSYHTDGRDGESKWDDTQVW